MAASSEKINQYRKLLSFILKYWNSDLFKNTATTALGTDTDIDIETDGEKEDQWYDQSPDELVEDLEQMGATYIKLGQLLSTRPDFLPERYLQALSDLQDKAEPISFDKVKHIVEKEINTDISKAFENFETEPLASASIGQVHRATLRSGKEVAVKVQRPGIREQFLNDLNTLTEIANLAVEHTQTGRKYAVDALIEDLRRILTNELDYTKEAQNLSRLHYNLRSFNKLVVPRPVSDYTTSKVLTMEFIPGKKVIDLSPVKQIEMDSDELVEAYLKQIMIDGFVHADPHPGNIHLTKDYRLALLDLGMVAQISPTNKDYLHQLMTALSENDGEKICDILINMGELQGEHDIQQFRKTVNRLVLESQNAAAKEMKTGRLLIQMNQSAAQNGIDIPTDINILGKVLLNLDQIIGTLAPDYDFRESVRNHIWELMENKMREEIKPKRFMSTLIESKKLVEQLPQRLNKISEQLANNEYRLKVDAIDEKRLTDGFQKVANRITLGLIIAATIIGAAMLMNVPTEFTLLGYPGLAIIFFLLAAIGGVSLIYYIIFEDEHYK